MTTYLCIDLGEKRIGLAVGSLESRLARKLSVINHQSRKLDIEKILKIAGENQADQFVIGISYQENGEPNSMGRHALTFGAALHAAGGLPVEYCDESLSTMDAREKALGAGLSRKDRGGHQDALAAEIILQSYFDTLPKS
jgi:putative Holliday junction resolvase